MIGLTLIDLFNYITDKNKRPDLLNYRLSNSWKSISTDEFGKNVRELAAGLWSMGIRKGENIGIISNSSPFWVIADFAIMLCGGITVPVFNRISPENLEFEINDSGLDYIFIADKNEFEQVKQHNKRIKKIITIGLDISDTIAIDFNEMLSSGRKALEKNEGLLYSFYIPAPDDLATVIYTSGSMGFPKGVMLSHENLMSQVIDTLSVFPIDKKSDKALTSLPLAHTFERMIMYYYLAGGAAVYFVDDLKQIGEIAREIKPTIMTVVPRLLERIHATMNKKFEEMTGFTGTIGRAAMKRAVNKEVGKPFRGLDYLFKRLVYSKLNRALGGRFRYVVSGSAALAPETVKFFLNIGVPLFEGYGLTEASPVISANCATGNRLGTVGRAFPSVEVKISNDGEILAKGPSIMMGYRNNAEATKEALDNNGFLHTGDLGKIDSEGFLSITGRKKELMKKSTGEYVPPVPIEQALKKLEIIEEAVVIAEGRKFVSALLFLNTDAVSQLRLKSGSDGISLDEFSNSDYIRKMVEDHIKEMNRHLHHTEEVQKYLILKSALSVETGELTPTLKIRRHIIEEKFKKEIDDIYKD